MMEKINGIYLVGGDALAYLAEPMCKKQSTKFVWGHPFSTYASYDQFLNSPLPVRSYTYFG